MPAVQDEEKTPIKQDVKKGNLRFYPYNMCATLSSLAPPAQGACAPCPVPGEANKVANSGHPPTCWELGDWWVSGPNELLSNLTVAVWGVAAATGTMGCYRRRGRTPPTRTRTPAASSCAPRPPLLAACRFKDVLAHWPSC